MEAQKSRIDELEKAINQAKVAYNEAMANLNKISEDVNFPKINFISKQNFLKLFQTQIHLKRKLKKELNNLPPRESGVGAESPHECVMDNLNPD